MQLAVKIQVDPGRVRLGQMDVQSIFMLVLMPPVNRDEHGMQSPEEVDQLFKMYLIRLFDTNLFPYAL